MDIKDWINQHRNDIYDPKDYVIFDEVIGCFKAGFLRASYILGWIGITENLKDKISQASNLGNKQAEASFKAIEEAESKKLSVDKIILEEAFKLNLVSISDHTVLSFLWQQRCLFAHPYNLAPLDDDVRHMITNSVKICLSKPLLYNKDFLNELVENIVGKPFLINGDRGKIETYFRKITSRVPEDLHPYLFKKTLYQLGLVIEDETKSDIRFKLRVLINTLLDDTTLSLDGKNWTFEDKAIKFPFVVLYGTITLKTWKGFSKRIKDIIVNYSIDEEDVAKVNIIKLWFNSLIINQVLEDEYKEKFFSKLDKMQFTIAINFYAEKEATLKRLFLEFDSFNFINQNSVIEHLNSDNGKKFVTTLEENEQIELGKKIMSCAKSGSYSGINYITNLKDKDVPKFVLYGILYGTIFNKLDGLNIKLNYFRNVIDVIAFLVKEEAENLLIMLNEKVSLVKDDIHYLSNEDIDLEKNYLLERGSEIDILACKTLEILKKFIFNPDDL